MKNKWWNLVIILGVYFLFRLVVIVINEFGLIPIMNNFIFWETVLELAIILIMFSVNHWIVKQKIDFRFNIKSPFLSLGPVFFLMVILFSVMLSDRLPRTYGNTLPLALSAGFFEEYLCRGLLFPQIFQALSEKKERNFNQVYLAIFLSSLIFSSLHLLNLRTQDLPTTLMQMWEALCAGIFFSALYLAANSLLPSILFHFLFDFIGMYTKGPVQQRVQVNSASLKSIAIITLIFLGYSLLLINKKKLSKQFAWVNNLIS
ncbi:CPBP family intramembrane glutamic endopeptidase [Xylocopilactobacillus apicola]|uniref:CPBP family intramembrane glutamic endopeptidase n=1 Tax=Xylocopilactobacillus apicola TaxID=2932184 RepID=UPI0029556793|nr:CPBP family intramembrane glutamic endopeptidase [Xylocopilactobacillus apicola]